MLYTKPTIVATTKAMSSIQLGIAKPGQQIDNEVGTTSAYRADE